LKSLRPYNHVLTALGGMRRRGIHDNMHTNVD